MTGPKHLWSGNWEDESSSQDEPAPRRPFPPAAPQSRTPAPTPPTAPKSPMRAAGARRQPEPSTPARPRPKRRRGWIAAAGTLVAAAIAAVIIIASSGGSSKPHQAITPSAPPAPSLASATTPTTSTPQPASPPAVSWLGMELTTVPPGGATVETVKLGSVADKAGLSPGEVILAVDGHQVSSAQGIAQAISGKHAGDQVQLEISHGSADYQTEVTLGAPPTRYP